MFFLIEFWRNLWRDHTRSLLTIGIAMCLFSFAGVYFGNIGKNEALLYDLSGSIPVPVQVSNPDGTQEIGLEIDSKRVEALLLSDIRDPVYTAQAVGNLKGTNRVEDPRSFDTALWGVNGAAALFTPEVTLTEGDALSFLAGDAAKCLLSSGYAREHGLGVGDTLTLPIHTVKYASTGSAFQYAQIGEISLQVAGILRSEMSFEGR